MRWSRTTDIHQRLCDLLDREKAAYRVVEHAPEGRTEFIARIRGNRLDQAIKSIVVQVRHCARSRSKKENKYCLANVPGDCRVDLEAHPGALRRQLASPSPRARRPRRSPGASSAPSRRSLSTRS